MAKKDKAMVIYLKGGVAVKVEKGTEVKFGDGNEAEYAIVSELKNGELNNLTLYNRDSKECCLANAAFVSAFKYEYDAGREDFLKKRKKFRKEFLKNVEKSFLRDSEIVEMKKFLYAIYLGELKKM